MAIWQYDLFLIAEDCALPVWMDDGWDCPGLPVASTISAQAGLVRALGHPWLMMNDWVVFGKENRTRVDFFFDDADQVSIHVRLDASATESELDTVCWLTGELKGRLFDPATGTLTQPDRRSLASALAASRAAAFARAPRAFPEGLP